MLDKTSVFSINQAMKMRLVISSYLLLLPAAILSAAPSTIEVIANFDYPRASAANTFAGSIANNGNSVGIFFTHVHNLDLGYERTVNGRFSQPISFPASTLITTFAEDINNSGTICGYFITDTEHGFFYDGHNYTQFDVAGSADTHLFGENDSGDFVGNYSVGSPPVVAFADLGGTLTTIAVAGSSITVPFDINNLGQIAGYYAPSTPPFTLSGFFRDADGTFVAPINYPGASGTALLGVNDNGWMSGTWTDNFGIQHGMLFRLPSEFISFDYPGATQTTFHGINNSQMISGYYIDSAGDHGFIAQLQP